VPPTLRPPRLSGRLREGRCWCFCGTASEQTSTLDGVLQSRRRSGTSATLLSGATHRSDGQHAASEHRFRRRAWPCPAGIAIERCLAPQRRVCSTRCRPSVTLLPCWVPAAISHAVRKLVLADRIVNPFWTAHTYRLQDEMGGSVTAPLKIGSPRGLFRAS
jgi:hypothetical protein